MASEAVTGSAAVHLPEKLTLEALREAVQGCRGCDLYRKATQAVFGKRRIHQKPNWTEIAACRPWLDAELAVVQPRVLVCLGATAAQALLGRDFRVSRSRGELVDSPLAEVVTATVHPSSILRAEDRETEYAAFVADLKRIARHL